MSAIPDDLILWEAERQIGRTLSAQEFQEAVMAAKLWLMQGNGKLALSVVDGRVRASFERMDGDKGSVDEWDLNAAMAFLIRVYRLQKGLTNVPPSA